MQKLSFQFKITVVITVILIYQYNDVVVNFLADSIVKEALCGFGEEIQTVFFNLFFLHYY